MNWYNWILPIAALVSSLLSLAMVILDHWAKRKGRR